MSNARTEMVHALLDDLAAESVGLETWVARLAEPTWLTDDVGRRTDQGRTTPPAKVPANWHSGHEALADELRAVDPVLGVPYGPPVSPASLVAARLTEPPQ